MSDPDRVMRSWRDGSARCASGSAGAPATSRGAARKTGPSYRLPRTWRLADGMINYHTMTKMKVAVTLDADLLDQVDLLVRERRFPNRSQAIESALAEKLERLSRTRLARECAKLDPAEERRLADEGLSEDLKSWPAY